MRKLGYLFGICLLFISCWERQRHDITAPEIPHYHMTGQVFDRDSRRILPNIEIQVRARGMLFETDFSTAADTTDSLGYFSFPSLVPGLYEVFGMRENRPVGLLQLLIFDADRQIELLLPKPVDAVRVVNFSKKEPYRFLGFCWKYSGTLAGVGYWDAGKFSENRVFEGHFETAFEVLGKKNVTPMNPDFYGLTYLDRYWTCDSTHLLSISSITGKFESTIPVPFELIDLTNDGKNIWGSMERNRLLKFDLYSMEVFQLPTAALEGIAWDGQNLWVADAELQLIFQLDANLQIIRTISPFFIDAFFKPHPLETYRFMAFDPAGHLWLGNEALLFEFDIK
jgi:hypothetical protein